MRGRLLFSLGVLLWAGVAGGQEAPPAACEQQVLEQYRQLSTDRALQTSGFAPQTSETHWGGQLLAITSHLRKGSTVYDIKKNQAELAERNVAELFEQLRLAGVRLAALQAEVERLQKNGAPRN